MIFKLIRLLIVNFSFEYGLCDFGVNDSEYVLRIVRVFMRQK